MVRGRPRLVDIGISRGEAVTVGAVTLVPRAWRIRVDVGRTRLAWTSALDVTVWDGRRRRRFVVPDITRILQVVLLGAALASVLLWRRGHPRERSGDVGR